MTDRERVVNRLKRLIKTAHHDARDFVYVTVGTAGVIVRLLEEQERDYIVRCKDCRWWHESETNKGYGDCGQANGITLKQSEWFCADGEVRK